MAAIAENKTRRIPLVIFMVASILQVPVNSQADEILFYPDVREVEVNVSTIIDSNFCVIVESLEGIKVVEISIHVPTMIENMYLKNIDSTVSANLNSTRFQYFPSEGQLEMHVRVAFAKDPMNRLSTNVLAQYFDGNVLKQIAVFNLGSFAHAAEQRQPDFAGDRLAEFNCK